MANGHVWLIVSTARDHCLASQTLVFPLEVLQLLGARK